VRQRWNGQGGSATDAAVRRRQRWLSDGAGVLAVVDVGVPAGASLLFVGILVATERLRLQERLVAEKTGVKTTTHVPAAHVVVAGAAADRPWQRQGQVRLRYPRSLWSTRW